jgi:tetratricopeptide (TPR) repeat protein
MNKMRSAIVLVLLVLPGLCVAACGDSTSTSTPVEQSADDILDQGLRAHAEGRLNEAATAYHQVLVKDPTNKYAFYNLGLIQHTGGFSMAAES